MLEAGALLLGFNLEQFSRELFDPLGVKVAIRTDGGTYDEARDKRNSADRCTTGTADHLHAHLTGQPKFFQSEVTPKAEPGSAAADTKP